MRVDITDADPDVQHLHSGHIVWDTFDLYNLGYAIGLLVCAAAICFASGRLFWRRKDAVRVDAKKRA